MGGGTQERPQHVFLSAGTRCLWMVRPQAGDRALHRGSASVRLRSNVQANGDHVPISASAVGLLAARKAKGGTGALARPRRDSRPRLSSRA